MKTLVFGASLKEERYSNAAIRMLREYDHEVVAIGGRVGTVVDVEILRGHPDIADIHTITMYMRAQRQEDHLDFLMGLTPKRVIFNPGAENPKFEQILKMKGVEVLRACTLVLLRTNQYSDKEIVEE